MIAVAERWRGEAPAAVTADDRRAEHDVAIAYRNGAAGLCRAAQHQRVVIAAAAGGNRRHGAIAVAGQQQIACRAGRHGINGDRQGDGGGDVTGGVGGNRAERISTICQRGGSEAPLTAAVGNSTAQQRGAVVQRDDGVSARQAAQHRRAVFGTGAIAQRAQRGIAIVGNLQRTAG